MSDRTLPTHSAFEGHQLLASGTLLDVAIVVAQALSRDRAASILVFSNASGQQVELDLSGGTGAIAERYAPAPAAVPVTVAEAARAPAKTRGRPRLGVVSREVTLLPEHWDWLAGQPGGASVALRKLVLQAMRSTAGAEAARRARERAYAFMAATAGNLAGFEEAARALFAGDLDRLSALTSDWPRDIRGHVLLLAQPYEADRAE